MGNKLADALQDHRTYEALLMKEVHKEKSRYLSPDHGKYRYLSTLASLVWPRYIDIQIIPINGARLLPA
jgi:hypothetical protein